MACVAIEPTQTVGQELLYFRKKRLILTQDELGEKLGVSRATISHWETDTHEIPQHHLDKLRLLGFQGDVGAPSIPAPVLAVPIPYIGYVSASSQADWTDPYETDTFEYVPPQMADTRGTFCCRVESDSMYPLLQIDDLLVFQRDPLPRVGKIILFRSNDNKITIKRLKHDGQDFILVPENAKYESCKAEGTVVGFLIGMIRTGDDHLTRFNKTGLTFSSTFF